MYPLLLSERSLAGWPRVLAEEVMRQAHRLRRELLAMGGKIQGKPLLPLPENLDGPDDSSAILDRWVLVAPAVPAELGWGPGQHVPWGEVGARTPARSQLDPWVSLGTAPGQQSTLGLLVPGWGGGCGRVHRLPRGGAGT